MSIKTFQKAPIVEIISRYTELNPISKGFMGFCPLHDNVNTPALVVYPNDGPETAQWMCFGCHPKSDDVISFVMLAENCTFKEALKICTDTLTTTDAFMKELEKTVDAAKDTLYLYTLRAYNLIQKEHLSVCNKVFQEMDSLIESGKMHKIDRLLSEYKV